MDIHQAFPFNIFAEFLLFELWLQHFHYGTSIGRTIHRPSRKQDVREHSGAIAAVYTALATYVKN
jgi:hypothetical protein